MAARKTPKTPKQVETLTHDEASRKNIPTAELQSVMTQAGQTPIQVAYQRRDRDPQLVWRGKDEQDQLGSMEQRWFRRTRCRAR